MSELTTSSVVDRAQPGAAALQASQDVPTWELLRTCVHCGLCLNHCPTYKVLGTEMDSPRGRIYQVLQVNEGKMALGESFATHIDRCLGCLACEIACPSGVKYGASRSGPGRRSSKNITAPFLRASCAIFSTAGSSLISRH